MTLTAQYFCHLFIYRISLTTPDLVANSPVEQSIELNSSNMFARIPWQLDIKLIKLLLNLSELLYVKVLGAESDTW